jgi:hypothetical protein
VPNCSNWNYVTGAGPASRTASDAPKILMPLARRSRGVKVGATPVTPATSASLAPTFVSDSGLTNLPLHDFTQNQIYCAIVALACEITPWMQLLALTHHPARRWEPKRLRLRLLSIAAHLTTTTTLRFPP